MIEAFVLGFQEVWNDFFSPKMFDFFGKGIGALVVTVIMCSPFALGGILEVIWRRRRRKGGK